jgi:hypothetical protein
MTDHSINGQQHLRRGRAGTIFNPTSITKILKRMAEAHSELLSFDQDTGVVDLNHIASVMDILKRIGAVISIWYEEGARRLSMDDWVIEQLVGFRNILETILKVATTDDAAGSSRSTCLEQLHRSNELLVECKIELKNLETCLRRNIEHESNNNKQSPSSLFDEIIVQKILDIVERLKVALNDAGHVDQRYDIESY